LQGLTISLATWGLYFCVLWPRMLFEEPDGIYSGWRTIWGDWAAHFAYANVFAYRPVEAWFSSHPLFFTESFNYPFLADGLSGMLIRAGMGPVSAFLLPSIVTSLFLVALLYSFYYAQLLRSPPKALLATTLFFTSGGVGFLLFARDLAQQPSLSLLRFPPREYTYLPDFGIQWINIVSSELLPQRALLLAIPLALCVLIPLIRYARTGFSDVSNFRLCALGLVASVLVVTHIHTYMSLAVLCGMLFLFDLRHYKQWLLFAGAASSLSLAPLWLIYGDTAGRSFVEWHPGWLANSGAAGEMSIWLFLWLNWGVFLPIATVSVLRFRYYRDPLVVGGILLFVLCFFIRFQPNLWDNTKILTWAHLILCIPVAHYLASLWAKRRLVSRGLAGVLFVFATASGFLELWRLTDTGELAMRMWSKEEIALAEAFREVSAPTALVLCSDYHLHWVPTLSGRTILLGFRGWLWSYGIEYVAVERDVRTMLAGGPDAEALMHHYGVEFATVGPSERDDYGADESYFTDRHQLILEGADYKVFRIEPAPRSNSP
jgi:hypothetical protein